MHSIPYLVLTNFLGANNNRKVLDCISQLEDKMTVSLFLENGIERTNINIKKNKNLWLNAMDDLEYELSQHLSQYLVDTRLLRILNSYPNLSHMKNSATRPYSTLLSKYVSSDFYDWHVDVNGFVTWSYVCYNDKVIGGDFILSDATLNEKITDSVKIPCTNDTLIIFPANYQHKVEEIQKGERYSLQFFFR